MAGWRGAVLLRGGVRRVRSVRPVVGVLVAVVVVGVVWVTQRGSELSEVQVRQRAEEVSAMLLAAADGVPRVQDDIVDSEANRVETELSDPWRYWQVRVDVELAPDASTTPPQVEQAMIAVLAADGWSADHRNDALSGGSHTFRKREAGGVWTVVLGAWADPPPSPQAVYFWVVSPSVDH